MVHVAFPACTASMVLLVCQAAMDVTDVMELKVIKDCRGRLDLRNLLVIEDLLVQRERRVLKENLEPRVLLIKKG